MRFLKTKICIVVFFIIFTFFFTNDFGLIDIEKTAIITAVAIDKSDDGMYEVSTQIAVHEATDTNEEKRKALVTANGQTIGQAIKNIGNITGWFPKLSFCNLILISEDFKDTNVIRILDYFSKTLRVQDSALVCMTEKKARDVLDSASPLDQISSFAIQKILLKNPGFDKDVFPVDIRTFTSGYYSDSRSSIMPYIKLNEEALNNGEQNSGANSGGSDNDISGGSSNGGTLGGSSSSGSSGSAGSGSSGSAGGSQSNSSGDSSGEQKNTATLFDATSCVLFVDGRVKNIIDKDLTWTLNLLLFPTGQNAFSVNDVDSEVGGANYLLTIIRNNPNVKLTANENNINLNLSVDLYCKISDQNTNSSSDTFTSNTPLPFAVKEKAKSILLERIQKLIQMEKDTKCDFLGLRKQLYRFNYPYYAKYKDNFLDLLNTKISVNVNGQK